MPKYRPEPERFFEKIDRMANGCWIWTAAISQGTGYGAFQYSRTRQHVSAHRWSYEYHKGPIPAGMKIDHTCFNRACVNPEHLRLATHKQNLENRAGLNSNNRTGYRGVYFDRRTGRYVAQVTVDGKVKFLGRYPTAEHAAEVAREARLSVFTHNLIDRA